MNPADIDAIEAQWHRLGVLMQMAVPDAAEVERQYAACLQTVPTMIAALRELTAPVTMLTADDAVHIEYGGEA